MFWCVTAIRTNRIQFSESAAKRKWIWWILKSLGWQAQKNEPVPSLTIASKELQLEWWLLMYASLLVLQNADSQHIPNITIRNQHHEWTIIQTRQILITIAVMISCNQFLIQILRMNSSVTTKYIYIIHEDITSSDVGWWLVCPHWRAPLAPSTFAEKVVDRSQLHFAPPQSRYKELAAMPCSHERKQVLTLLK